MSAICKLCTRQLVDEDIEQIAGHEARVELLEHIFAKFNLQYDDTKDILCVACQKNLKAVKLVVSRWQEAQKKQRTTVIMTVKTTTTPTKPAPKENPKQETLLKKPTASAASVVENASKDQLEANKKSTENAKIQNIRLSKSPIQKKVGAAATVIVSASPTKIKTKVEKPNAKTEECQEEMLQLTDSDDDEKISPNKVRLTRSVLKRQQKTIAEKETETTNQELEQKTTAAKEIKTIGAKEIKTIAAKEIKTIAAKETKTIAAKETKKLIEQKPTRKIHNIGFKREVQKIEDDEEYDELEALQQPQLEHSNPKNAKNNKNNDSAELLVPEYEQDEVNEIANNVSDLEFQGVEPVDINDIGSMLQVGLIRSANGVTVAQIFEEYKNGKMDDEKPIQSCIICELCQDVIGSIRDFHKHLKGHVKNKYECKDCRQTFSTLAIMQNHQKSADHKGVNTINTEEDQKMIFFECVSCEKVFLELFNMSRHHRDVHRARSDRFKCTQCGANFKYKVSLTEHIAKHMKINMNSISCDHCDRMFKNNYQLNRHMRIHTGEKPYECDTCKKLFRHSANLNVHKRTHTGELPFKCVICAKGFSTSTHMRRHLKSCQKRFSRISQPLPTMVTLKEEELRYEPQKSTKSEVVFTLNTEQIINSNQSDSLLKRSLVKEEGAGTKRRAVEITTPSPKKQQTQPLQKKQKQQEQQEQQVKIVKVEILPNIEKKLPTILKKCKLCTKVFKDPEALKLHMATHDKVPTYRCSLCGKRFIDLYLFRRHKLEHCKLSIQKAAAATTTTTTTTHDDDDDDNEDNEADEDEIENYQEIIDDEDDPILLDLGTNKLEPDSPTSSKQLQSHDDGVDTSTLNNFRIVTINDM